jgi:predicted metal-dependent hydrolase
MRATVAPNGSLRISVPSYAPIFMVKRMIASSRQELRKLLETHPVLALSDGMAIGKSHSLVVRSADEMSVRRTDQQLIVNLSPNTALTDSEVVTEVRKLIIAILRREAKHHLPRRLQYIADTHGFTYSALRFTHASSRWGSCNSAKNISLNIALMNLPFELIDYVLVHELAHTRHLNHSKEFWDEVAKSDSQFKLHRRQLKAYNPGV